MPITVIPEFNPVTGRFEAGQITQTPSRRVVPEADRPSLIGGGIRSGFNQLQAIGGAGFAGLGALLGSESMQRGGLAYAARNAAEAAQFGRPDLETAPWREGGSPVLPWMVYQTAKQLPLMAGLAGTTALTGGYAAPAALGAGVGFGSMAESAANDGEISRNEALGALALSPFYGAAEAFIPARVGKMFARGATQRAASKVIREGIIGEALTEGVQTGMELSFRPDMTFAEKSREIVDAALTGGMVGGVFTGTGSGAARLLQKTDQVTDEQLKAVVDDQIGDVEPKLLPAPDDRQQLTPPPLITAAPQDQVDGDVSQGPTYDAMGQAEMDLGDPENLTPAEPIIEPQKVYEGLSEDELLTVHQNISKRIQGLGPDAPLGNLSVLREMVETELLNRTPEPAAPTSPVVTSREAAIRESRLGPEFETILTSAKELLPKSAHRSLTNVLKSSRAKTMPELVASVMDAVDRDSNPQERLDAGTKRMPKAADTLAQAFGVYDRDTLDQREQKAMEKSERAVEAYRLDPNDKTEKAYKESLREVHALRDQRRLLSEADAIAADMKAFRVQGVEKATNYLGETTSSKVESGPVYDVKLAAGLEAPITRKAKGPEGRGWYFAETNQKIELAEGEKGVQGAAQAASRMLVEGKVNADEVLTGKGLRFKDGAKKGPGVVLSRNEVEQSVQEITQDWTGATDIYVVNSVKDLPKQLQAQARRQKDAPGMYVPDGDNQGIYVFSDNVTSPEHAKATVFHEALGHVGYAAAFGENLNKMMHSIYDNRPEVREWVDNYIEQKQKRGEPLQSDQRAMAVEELLALDAERGQVLASLRDVVTKWVRDVARRIGFQNLEFTDREMRAIMAQAHAAAVGGQRPAAQEGQLVRFKDSSGKAINMDTLPGLGRAYAAANGALEKGLDQLANRYDTDGSWRQTRLKWTSVTHILSRNSEMFRNYEVNGRTVRLSDFLSKMRKRGTIQQTFSKLAMHPGHMLEEWARGGPTTSKSRKSYKQRKTGMEQKLAELMMYTVNNINPAKKWDDHTWLHGAQDEATLKNEVKRAHDLYTQVKRSGAIDVYDAYANVNRGEFYAQQVAVMYTMINANPEIATAIYRQNPKLKSPMEAFLKKKLSSTDHAGVMQFWKDKSEEFVKAITPLLELNDRKIQAGAAQSDLLPLETLADQVGVVLEQQKRMEQGPYFHLGRFGKYWVRFPLPTVVGADGARMLDSVAAREVGSILNEVTSTPLMMQGDASSTAGFVRVESQREAERIAEVVRKMQSDGVIPAVQQNEDGTVSNEVKNGSYDELNQNLSMMKAAKTLIDAARTSEAFQSDGADPAEAKVLQDARKRLEGTINQFALDMMPDTSGIKTMIHRKSVPGFSGDMIRSYAHRTQIASHTLANMFATPEITQEFQRMNDAIKQAEATSDPNKFAMQDTRAELALRENSRSDYVARHWADYARALNHTFYLGMSPAYFLTNLTQIQVLLVPELAKKIGFKNAVGQAWNSANPAFKASSALLKESWNRGRWRYLGDLDLSVETLTENSGMSEKDAKFIVEIAQTGAIDIGNSSREQGRAAEDRTDSGFDRFTQTMGFMGLYSEVFTRMTAAFAARDTFIAEYKRKHGKEPDMDDPNIQRDVQAYAVDVIDQSMLNYSEAMVGRAFGRQGFIGELTPLATAFMQYNMQVLEKMYRETANLMSGTDPESRKESARFLTSHAAMVASLAGTLGLPAANAVIWAAEKAFGDDDEPVDFVAGYRNYLAQMFGKEAGEVIAHGLPRALLGVDWSIRTGEQDLIPFTRFLRDKREWKEKLSDQAVRGFGAPGSALINIADGMEMMFRGEVTQGMAKSMPTFMKGFVKGYSMAKHGYTDKNGHVLPMEPSHLDILRQLLGFTPSAKAEYDNARFMQAVRSGQQRNKASVIRRNLAMSIERGDEAAQMRWLREADEYDRANPHQSIIANIGRTLESRARARAIGEATGMPIGVNWKDPSAQALTGFANLR